MGFSAKKFLAAGIIAFVILISNIHQVSATACPVALSGGTLSSNTSLTADTYDCSSVDLTINNGVTLTMQGNTTSDTGVVLQVHSLNVVGSISANSQGYASSLGPGAGIDSGEQGSGAGHGAVGGAATAAGGSSYGSYIAPLTLGSGGGRGSCNPSGGSGGGAIKIIATTNVAVAGTISSNGGAGASACGAGAGGGSGGSVYIVTSNLSGSGTISANGGSAGTVGAGVGAGGRVFIQYSGTNSFNGTQTATKGSSGLSSGYNDGTNLTYDSTNDDLYIKTTQTWYSSPTLEGSSHSYHNVTITNNSTLYTVGYYTTNSNGVGAVFNVTNFTLDSGSSINGIALGYAGGVGTGVSGAGPGAGIGSNAQGSGAGYGGSGGAASNAGGPAYGSSSIPVDLGSGGGAGNCGAAGGTGGGAVKIAASNSADISGNITVNGGAGGTACGAGSGGGSGGSIYISASSLSGSGTLSANGGSAGTVGAGVGAGGRISIIYSTTNSFNGSTSVTYGVSGLSSILSYGTNLLYDSTNNDMYIKSTQLWNASPLLEQSSHTYRTFAISNSSILYTKGYFSNNSDGVGFVFNVTNFTIGSGSSINGSSLGYTGVGNGNGQGPSPGQGGCNVNEGGGGGGHGGVGGNANVTFLGGGTSGIAATPVLLGSAGGSGNCVTGNAGGSAIKVVATGTITLSGTISMDGQSVSGTYQGAGAGGSIYLYADILTGTSNLSAIGGNGNLGGGAGGGGRIAIGYGTTNSYSGSTLVSGGTGGAHVGGAGTATTVFLPQAPTSLTQYKSDSATVIASGATTQETTVILKMAMSASGALTLTPEVEIRAIGTAFSNITTNTGNGVSYTGSPVTGSVTISGLSDLTNYHWQSRVCNSGNCSTWVSYNGSPYDFRIVTNQDPSSPTSLGPSGFVDGSYTGDTTPSVTFTLADPDVSDTVKFNILIDDTSDYSSPVVNYTSALSAQGSASFTVGQATGTGSYSVGSVGQTLADGSYYWKVKAIDNSAASGSYTLANSGNVAFILNTGSPIGLSLDSPSDHGYINNERPTFRFKAAISTTTDMYKYILRVNNPSTGTSDPSGDFTIEDIPAVRTTDYETATYLAHYDNFGDADVDNNYISIYTKSSDTWDPDYNDGKLREGIIDWTIVAVDNIDNESQSSRTIYLDRTAPQLSLTKINNANYAGGDYSTSATFLTLNGIIKDTLAGGDSTLIQSENGPRVTSGIDKFNVTIDEYKNFSTILYSIYNSLLFPNYYSCDNTEITDNTKQLCDKYAFFNYAPSEKLKIGKYKISITGTDKAGNSAYLLFNLNILSPGQTTKNTDSTPKPQKNKTISPSPTPQIITVPQAEPSPSQAPTIITNLVTTINDIGNYILSVAEYAIQSLVQAFSTNGSVLASIAEWVNYSITSFQEIVLDNKPTQIADVRVISATATTATIYWQTNHLSTSKVSFGETLDYGVSVQSDEKVHDHYVEISGLTPGTHYYYEVMSQNSEYVYDAHHEFDTLGVSDEASVNSDRANESGSKNEKTLIKPLPVPQEIKGIGDTAAALTDFSFKVGEIGTIATGIYITAASAASASYILLPLYGSPGRSILNFPFDFIKLMFASAYQSLSAFIGLISGINIRKRRKNNGVVFNSLNHSPLAGAFVVSISPSGNLSTDCTDSLGRYMLEPRPDIYELKANKINYLYPSKIISDPTDTIFTHIYKPGEKIEIKTQGEKISGIALPMDPSIKLNAFNLFATKFLQKTRYILLKSKKILIPASFAITGLATLVHPTTYYLSIFGLNILLYLRTRSKFK